MNIQALTLIAAVAGVTGVAGYFAGRSGAPDYVQYMAERDARIAADLDAMFPEGGVDPRENTCTAIFDLVIDQLEREQWQEGGERAAEPFE